MRSTHLTAFLLSALLLLNACNSTPPQDNTARATIDTTRVVKKLDTAAFKKQLIQLAAAFDGKLGVALLDLQTGSLVSFNGDQHFPMQSVYKLQLGMAVLDQVDKGKLSLTQQVKLTPRDLLPETYSPLRDKYQGKQASVRLGEILGYTVSQSDNCGCDLLFRMMGGPGVVNTYMHNAGMTGMAIVSTEEEMHADWSLQYQNWCTPEAMCGLLARIHKGDLLAKASNDTLLNFLRTSPTGPKRLRAGLPEGTILAHKTGTSGTEKGITAAVNDAGIVTLPDGRSYAITVFVSNSKTGTEKMEELIAQVSKAAWNSFL